MNFREKNLFLRVFYVFIGLSIYSFALVCFVQSDLGLSPWDIFHQGISLNTSLTMGQASMVVGFSIVLFNYLMKEKVGIGTIMNVFVIGILFDFIVSMKIIPKANNYYIGFLLLIVGVVLISLGSFFYQNAGLGVGPGDGLILIISKATNFDVAIVRNAIELTLTLLGVLLGGKLGVGTLVFATSVGFLVKFFFKIFNMDIKAKHDYLDRSFYEKIFKRNIEEKMVNTLEVQ